MSVRQNTRPAPGGRGIRASVNDFTARHRSIAILLTMSAVAVLLPLVVLLPPFSSLLGPDHLDGRLHDRGRLRAARPGPQHRGGPVGPPGPRVRCVLRHRRVHRRVRRVTQYDQDWPFWIILLVGAVMAAVFGILLGAPTLRLRGDYLAIVTLGFGEIVPIVFLNARDLTEGPNGIGGISPPSLGGLGEAIGLNRGEFPTTGNPWPFYLTMLVLITISMILIYRLQDSRLGRSWMAIREDELAASANGINTVVTKLLAFALGASTAGIAGVFMGSKLTLVSPNLFRFDVSFTILAMVVLGGMGNIWGVAIGAFIIFMIQSVFLKQLNLFFDNANVPILSDINFLDYQFLLYGIALVAMMLLRPEGLFPSRRRKRELHTEEDVAFGDLGDPMGQAPE